jgi:SNF2 family DNA or RNA helicase
MIFEPREYQKQIINYILENPRCAIWASMGSGKTVATATAIDALRMLDDSPVLVLAPLRVAKTTWPGEFAKWQHLRHLKVTPIVGNEKQRRAALRTDSQIFTTNYEQIEWLVETYGGRWPFRTVICDESTRLKGFRLRQGTKRAKALAKVAHTLVDRIVLLTGTPAPNGLIDLWGQLHFADKGERLGRTFNAFKERYFKPNFNGYGVQPVESAQEQIQSAVKDICLTVDVKDYMDIKEPIVNKIYFDLPAKSRKIYDELEKEMFTQLGEYEVEAFNAAARTIKCLQATSGFLYVGEDKDWTEFHDDKLDILKSIEAEAAGMPILVAYHFKPDLARLQKAFPHGRVLDKNPETIAAWNRGEIPMLFAHPQSAGHGLSLQDGSNIMVFYGLWWNLEENAQIIERIGPTRQAQSGHDRAVFIHYILARDTVDELVLERLESKKETQQILLDAMKRKGYK